MEGHTPCAGLRKERSAFCITLCDLLLFVCVSVSVSVCKRVCVCVLGMSREPILTIPFGTKITKHRRCPFFLSTVSTVSADTSCFSHADVIYYCKRFN